MDARALTHPPAVTGYLYALALPPRISQRLLRGHAVGVFVIRVRAAHEPGPRALSLRKRSP